MSMNAYEMMQSSMDNLNKALKREADVAELQKEIAVLDKLMKVTASVLTPEQFEQIKDILRKES